ncbi:MAG: glycine betaine ABC transporter substrate-binding protein, partial [Pseudomonadota bacterium]
MRILTTALAVGMLSTSVYAADLGAVDEPIKLAINEWTGQHVSTHVAGAMLEAAGYEVEYVTAGYMNMYQAMADGEIHGAMEIWS